MKTSALGVVNTLCKLRQEEKLSLMRYSDLDTLLNERSEVMMAERVKRLDKSKECLYRESLKKNR